MKTKYTLYVFLWLLIMVVLASDSFSYYATRKIVKGLFLYADPNISIRTILKFHEFIRKSCHVLNFAVLSWLILCAWAQNVKPLFKWTPKAAFFIVLICLMYSISEEWRQSFTQYRTPRILDIFLDLGGATITQLICWLIVRVKQRPSSSEMPLN